MLCNEKSPCCLDFHHVKKKNMSVSKMVNKGRPKYRILREIKKCVILCACCHIKVHKGKGPISTRNRSYIEKYVIKIKNAGKCSCGERSPFCLQFDHINPDEKVATINELIRQRADIDTIKEEVNKCVLKCANCHRKRHSL